MMAGINVAEALAPPSPSCCQRWLSWLKATDRRSVLQSRPKNFMRGL
jgi:hypothetical protein